MFAAQILLCSSIAAQCIGFEDDAITGTDILACEKRIEEIIVDARDVMPWFRVVHADCKKLPGLSV